MQAVLRPSPSMTGPDGEFLARHGETSDENVVGRRPLRQTSRMAFRIHESVVRGEIDNRVKGIVRGKIWVEARAEPVTLELKGNAWPDLAGCLLTFTNPQ